MSETLVAILLLDGRWLALGVEALREALARGEELRLGSSAVPAPPPMGPERLLTSRELAELVGVADTTVEAMAARGEIPCVRIGRALRFEPTEVLKFLKSGHADKRTAAVAKAVDPKGRSRQRNRDTTAIQSRRPGADKQEAPSR